MQASKIFILFTAIIATSQSLSLKKDNSEKILIPKLLEKTAAISKVSGGVCPIGKPKACGTECYDPLKYTCFDEVYLCKIEEEFCKSSKKCYSKETEVCTENEGLSTWTIIKNVIMAVIGILVWCCCCIGYVISEDDERRRSSSSSGNSEPKSGGGLILTSERTYLFQES